MLDVHPPHAPTHTWKDFLIHIATIVIGLLIAIGLEQTVEWLHRRHLVAETRVTFDIERRDNRNRFAVTTEQFERFVPILERNLSVFVALREHPGHTGALPQLDWNQVNFDMVDGAWQTARQNNVLAWMPVAEAREEEALYRRLHVLNDDIEEVHKASIEATLFEVNDPDPSHLSAPQLDHEMELTARLLQAYRAVAYDEGNLRRQFPDFDATPKPEDVQAIHHRKPSADWLAYVAQVSKRVRDFDQAQNAEGASSK